MRQNDCPLQILYADNTDKTEEANYIALYQVSSSIHKDDFYT